MVDLATIGIVADTRSLKKGEVAMNRFASTGEITERRVKKSSTSMSAAVTAVGASAVRMAAVAGAAMGAFLGGKLFIGAIREQEQLQRNMLKTQGIIEATGGAAGRSADQLLIDARALARATLLSTEGIMAAQQTMLTFRNITGDTFDQAIAAAADMSQALGTDVKSAVLQLGKALEDPVTGMSALSRSGTVFTQSQKDLVKAMVEVGDTAGAQAFILGELEKQYGGVAEAAAGGLGGVMDGLGQSFQEFQIALAGALGLGSAAGGVMLGLANTLDFLAQNMDAIRNIGIITASIYAGPIVKAFVAARISAFSFAGALGLVKSALILTGIGALIVGAGVLATWFGKLVNKAGGFGAALGLLGEVAVGAWDDMKAGAWSLYLKMGVVSNSIQFAWVEMLRSMSKGWANFTGNLAAGMEAIPFMGGAADSLRQYQGEALNTFAALGTELVTLDSAMTALEKQQASMANRSSSTVEALMALKDMVNDTSGETEGSTEATAAFTAALENIPNAASAASGAVVQTGDAVETMADKMRGIGQTALKSLGSAFNDFMGRGFKDFKSFARSVVDTFKKMILQMIAMAAKSKIMKALKGGGGVLAGVGSTLFGGAGAATAGGVGGAAGGGLLAGAIGGFATAGTAAVGTTAAVAATAGTGLLGGLGASLGVGGAAGGGIFGIGASAAAAGGTLMATIGAALPLLGIGLAIFSLFKKKPPISKKDFAAVQTGLSLTGMALLETSRAGKKAAAGLKKAFGGIEAMTKATESYYKNFFTDEEKRLSAISSISAVFDNLGMTVPATANDFRDIVEAQDLMTKGGQKTYAALVGVSEAFAGVYGGVNSVTSALDTLTESFGGSIFSTLVDERRAAAYKKNSIAFDVTAPDRAGGGVAYRGTGQRVVARSQSDDARLAELERKTEEQTTLLASIFKNGKRALDISDNWNTVGLPPTRT